MPFAERSRNVVFMALGLTVVAACSDTTEPEPTDDPQIVGSGLSLALVGPRVTRHASPDYATERERVLVRGEMTEAGCRYKYRHRVPLGAEPQMSWQLYSDGAACLTIMSRGPYDVKRAAVALSPKVTSPRAEIAADGQASANASADVEPLSGSEQLATSAQTAYLMHKGNFVVLDARLRSQFRYNLSPDCIRSGLSTYLVFYYDRESLGVESQWPPTNTGMASACNGNHVAFFAESTFLLHYPVCPSSSEDLVFAFQWQSTTLLFQSGGLWREYSIEWRNDFYRCGAAQNDFTVQVIHDPLPGLV
jgi:hypothetical protein